MNDRQLTGNIGLFYTCYRLSLRNWNVMPTVRNAKGADIIIVSTEGNMLGIQVKTLANEADVFIGKNYKDPSVKFWVVLMNVRTSNQPLAYIIPAEDVRNGVESCNNGRNSDKDLVYRDNVKKADGSFTCYLNKKFLKGGAHSYGEAWENIG